MLTFSFLHSTGQDANGYPLYDDVHNGVNVPFAKFLLTHQEGKPPELILSMRYVDYIQYKNTAMGALWAHEKSKKTLLFQGIFIQEEKINFKEGIIHLKFIALKSRDKQEEKLKDMCENLRTALPYDALLDCASSVEDSYHKELEELMLYSQDVVHYNRLGDLGLSSLWKCARAYDVSSLFMGDGQIKRDVPLNEVSVKATISWKRHMCGMVNISPLIAGAFGPHGASSYNDIFLEKRYYENGYSLIKNNIHCIKEDIMYFDLHTEKKDEKKFYSVRLKYFDVDVCMSYHHENKHTETLCFLAKSPWSPYRLHYARKDIETVLRVPSVLHKNFIPSMWYWKGNKIMHEDIVYMAKEDHASDIFEKDKWEALKEKNKNVDLLSESATFFPTSRGKRSVEALLALAQRQLMLGNRVEHLSVTGPLHLLMKVTLDDGLYAKGVYEGQQMEFLGKMTGYTWTFDANGKKSFATLTASSFPPMHKGEAKKDSEDIARMGFPDEVLSVFDKNKIPPSKDTLFHFQHMEFLDFRKNIKPDPLREMASGGGHMLVKNIHIKNKAEEQEEILRNLQHEKDLENFMKNHEKYATSLEIQMAPLKNPHTFSQDIFVEDVCMRPLSVKADTLEKI